MEPIPHEDAATAPVPRGRLETAAVVGGWAELRAPEEGDTMNGMALIRTTVQHFARYSRNVHHCIKFVEPWGILIAAVGIYLATHELREAQIERQEVREERQDEQALREVTLFAMASEILQKAREVDEVSGEDYPVSRIGQVSVLEAMARSGFSMEGINARDTSLNDAHLADAKFQNANFWGASFVGANLERADLRNTNLTNTSVWC